jgi:hypothetical protein
MHFRTAPTATPVEAEANRLSLERPTDPAARP